jgi:hypothetical protein
MAHWVEIINLRAAGGTESVVTAGFLFSLVEGAEAKGLLAVKILTRPVVPTDFSLHLEWEVKRLPSGGSPLGMRFTGILRDYGLINHTVWKEEEEK